MTGRRRAAALVAASGLLLGACSGAPARSPAPEATVVAAPRGVARHVVVVSVDGLNRRAIGVLGRAGAPAFHRLLREGATTMNARTARERTETLPNHAGMMTGLRVAGSRGHHVWANDDRAQTTVHRLAGHYVASVFDVVHDRGGSTSLFTSKEKFALYARSWNRYHGAVDRVGADDGRGKIDRYVLDDPAGLARRMVARLRSRPDTLTFWHLRLPDTAGHAHGFMSRQYLAAVRASDVLLGRLLRAVRRDGDLRGVTTVVLTADHGGPQGQDHHDDVTLRDDFTVPLMVWGAGVRAGADLYTLNPDRRRPGWSRPTYQGPQPIRNLDVADLATTLLGLPPVPSGVPGTTPLEVS